MRERGGRVKATAEELQARAEAQAAKREEARVVAIQAVGELGRAVQLLDAVVVEGAPWMEVQRLHGNMRRLLRIVDGATLRDGRGR